MIANGYSVDLYCENMSDHNRRWREIGEGKATYTGETWGECARQARRDGWQISRDRQRAYCKYHGRKRVKK
jgi:hypothetical protein